VWMSARGNPWVKGWRTECQHKNKGKEKYTNNDIAPYSMLIPDDARVKTFDQKVGSLV
jgi:hypothetical protein